MSDDPRAHDREFWSRSIADRYAGRVADAIAPNEDIGPIPGEHGPFLSFEEWLATQDDEMHRRVLRAFPGVGKRHGLNPLEEDG